MSACKSSKTELIAIYRLEFYKKQKNWKFCTSRQEKKSSKKHLEKKINLNTTYDVQSHGEKDTSDPLNVAFVDSESENIQKSNSQPNLSKNRELSQKWLEPVNIWPGEPESSLPLNVHKQIPDEKCSNCSSEEKPKRNYAMQRLQELHNAAKLGGYEEDDNAQNFLKEIEPYPQDFGNTDYDANAQDTDCEWTNQYYCDGFHDEDKWPMQYGLMIGAGHMAQEIWSAEPEQAVLDEGYPEDAVYAPAGRMSVSADARQVVTPGLFDTAGDWCDTSVDSEGEFMRGADAAPHSSEIDLALPAPLGGPDVLAARPSQLSAQQLVQAARLHSRRLRLLLRESAHRQRLRSLATLNAEPNSFDEDPTRALGPAPPLCAQGVFRDVCVAGSHTGAAARGRGRLPEMGYRN
ncbi:uncharacterized protein LOC120625182 [Pararge aegeria]|uniref:uncharacterized protein LOC120625182 n=1 Tax=Pararge aegeria TaxID=116150 RepID=UPI0019D108E5|nr:uncharacterized protein LOC120625182 [Pararge aegeria]